MYVSVTSGYTCVCLSHTRSYVKFISHGHNRLGRSPACLLVVFTSAPDHDLSWCYSRRKEPVARLTIVLVQVHLGP